MLRNKGPSLKYKIIVLLFIIAPLSYVFPLFTQLEKINLTLLQDAGINANMAWLRSFLFALISSSFNILLSLWLAIKLRGIKLFSYKGSFLTILLLPILIGDVSIAFIGKVLFANNTILHENANLKFISLIFIQFWQYGTLFTYIFWLVIQGIKEDVKDFATGVRLSSAEYTKDIILPATRNIAILSFVLNFVFAFFENAKSQFIYRASRGTNSEFISRWLEKYYQDNTLFNIDFATSQTLQYGAVVMFSLLLIIILFSATFDYSYKKYLRSSVYLPSGTCSIFTDLLFVIIIAAVIIPVGWLILKLIIDTRFASDKLWTSVLITAIAALVSTLLSIQLGILLRLAWKNVMSTFSKKSLVFYAAILFILLFPPLVLYILGFKWLSVIGYQNSLLINAVWIIGHVFLVLPILSSFVAVTHYRTTNNEIEYLNAYKLNYRDKIKALFNRRYLLDYSLTFLISFSFIWNESTINNLLSDFIPSFISEMKMSISGRGTDYSSGIGYFFISISLAILAIILWNYIMRRIRIKLM
ncbi:MAG: hypothetical protein ACOCUV_01405 [bacterium]